MRKASAINMTERHRRSLSLKLAAGFLSIACSSVAWSDDFFSQYLNPTNPISPANPSRIAENLETPKRNQPTQAEILEWNRKTKFLVAQIQSKVKLQATEPMELISEDGPTFSKAIGAFLLMFTGKTPMRVEFHVLKDGQSYACSCPVKKSLTRDDYSINDQCVITNSHGGIEKREAFGFNFEPIDIAFSKPDTLDQRNPMISDSLKKPVPSAIGGNQDEPVPSKATGGKAD